MDDAKVFNGKDFSHQLRPAWTPVNMALMIFFFATGLWVFGLAMIAYMLYGREMGLDFSNWGKAKRSVNGAFDNARSSAKSWGTQSSSTGNAAFDDWREEEMARLDEERRKLDEARRDFEEYVRELRRARDREEFDAFRNNWNSRQNDGESPAV
ncbi:DUF2852 domain-containing protein [Parvularcula sp. LCG005]|uniref:DUF2852 domain-containing protein n=1 Tax=Parvularcula sp. LCG005 TaxID=3078805 RepID=UPI0029432F39|nr:DUF2852 domain-containing protein [Parvularcula sp. LCG005]WOI54229.1 DUF2852 domain-containing protein [Parvularcula sp. LCG005]